MHQISENSHATPQAAELSGADSMRSMSPPPLQLQASSESQEGESSEGDLFAPVQEGTSIGTFSGGPIQREGKGDNYADYKGDPVNKPGWVSAPGSSYEHAKTKGVNVREKPDGTLGAIGTILYGKQVQVVCHDNTGQFYYVVSLESSVTGWINKSFVTMDRPEPGATLHNIQESDLITILKQQYVDKGVWQISTGNDYTTLAAAIQVANTGRAGVSVDWAKVQEYKDKHPLKATLDPWMIDNFAIMHASDIVAGMNIWLPSASYIQTLQSSGVIGSRPDWLNTAVDIGKGMAGWYSGIYRGIFDGLWEMVEGLWEMGKQIVNTVMGVLDGSLFTSLKELYDKVDNMTVDDMMEMVNAIITMGQNAWGDFVTNWNAPNVFDKWHFRGRIVGQIVLEVVLAIFSGGATLGAKVVAKIAAKFPKLARILRGLLKAADKITPDRKKRPDGPDGPDGPDRPRDRDNDRDRDRDEDKDRDDDNDNKDDRAWEQTRAMAAMVTEGHDLKDTPVTELITHLNAQFAVPSRVVGSYKANPKGDGSYEVVQLARKKVVDPHYTDGNDRRDVDDHEGDELGHTVERHVGKSDNWLRRRLENNPRMEAASTFTSHTSANRAQGRFVSKHKADIAEWLKDASPDADDLVRDFDADMIVGRVLERGKSKPIDTSKVRVVIRRNADLDQGWYFVTSFPVP